MYESSFFLEGQVGNNAFSYDQRREHFLSLGLKKQPRLFVPSLIEGDLDAVQLGDEVVFEEVDEEGVLQSCVGLKHFVRTQWRGVETVIFDNHNHAFFFWVEALSRGVLQPGVTLIHVDQHKDTRRPEKLFDRNAKDFIALGESLKEEAVVKKVELLKEAFLCTNEVLNVGNYIVPAQEMGLVSELVSVTGEAGFLVGAPVKTNPGVLKEEKGPFRQEGMMDENKILNIDLDFFVPEMGDIDFEKAREFILEHLKTAKLVTIATSPFFMNQKQALERLRWLMEDFST